MSTYTEKKYYQNFSINYKRILITPSHIFAVLEIIGTQSTYRLEQKPCGLGG
jgi:hypothetical protein